MTLKDFKPGQVAYAISYKPVSRTNIKENYSIKTGLVVSVGRKYAYIKLNGDYIETLFYLYSKHHTYLTMREGLKTLLFLTEQDAKDYIDKLALLAWIRESAKDYKANSLTLEQLRTVTNILSGGNFERSEKNNKGFLS